MHRDIRCIQTSSVNLDGTAIRDHNAGEDLQKRGSSGTVLPDDPMGLTAANLKGDVAGRDEILVILFSEKNLFEPVGR